jgi:hypothetical protein
MLGIHTADPEAPEQIWLVRASIHAGGIVKHLAYVDARLTSSSRAASMSETIRYRPWRTRMPQG